MRQLLIGVVALGLLAGACGDDDVGASPDTTGSDADSTTTEPTDNGEGDDARAEDGGGVDDLSDAAISLTPVVELDWPTALATRAGSDHLYVAERAGRVVVVERSERGLGTIADELIDISDETTTDGERGLLGLTFDPTGERLYLSYTDLAGDTRLDEWTMDGDEPDETTRRTIFTLEQPTEFHNGGQVSFGPDGLLYLGLGDGASGDDPGQNPDTPLGSLLRIDPRGAGDEPYTIPDDNPFADGGGAPEIWAMGLRNPWRYSWDRATGDLWIADVGQDRVEEINFVPAPDDGSPPGRAANFGWAIFEGNEPFDGGPEPENYVPPIETYPWGPGCSVIGGYVSRGDALPDLMGVYVYTDLCDARLRLLLVRDGELVETKTLDDVTVAGGQPVSFGKGPDAELYVMSLVGGVFRLDPA